MATERITILVDEKGSVIVKKRIQDVGTAASETGLKLDKAKAALSGLGAAFAGLAGAISIGGLIALADTFTNIQNRMAIVTSSTEELNGALTGTYDIAQATYTSWEGIATVYARTAAASKELKLTQGDLLNFTYQLAQATALSGASAESANAALIQLSQGMASGTLRGEELNSVLEQLPYVANAIATGMGKTVGELRALAKDGLITPQAILTAFNKMSTSIEKDFDKMVPTVSMGLMVLKNGFIELMGQVEYGTGVFSILGYALTVLGSNLGTVALLLSPLVVGLAALTVQVVVLAGVQGIGLLIAALQALYTQLTLAATSVTLFGVSMARAAVVSTMVAWTQSMNTARVSIAIFAVTLQTQLIPAVVNAARYMVTGMVPALLATSRAMLSSIIPAAIATAQALTTNLVAAFTRTAAVASTQLIPALLTSARAMLTNMLPAAISLARTLATSLLVGIVAATAAFVKLSIALIANPFTIAVTGAIALSYAIYGLINGFDQANAKIVEFVETGKEKIASLIESITNATSNTDALREALSGLTTGGGKSLSLDGKSAGEDIKKAMKAGGNEAGAKISDNVRKIGTGFGTALEKANASGAKQLETGVKNGGDKASAAITAAGNIMAAKFEGTGRNIYDLWNNWGDQFIDSFGNTIGKMLVDFQRAQTNLLKAQAQLLKEQARNMELQNKYLERGKSLPGQGDTGGGDGDGRTSKGTLDPWSFGNKPAKKTTSDTTSAETYASREEAIRDVTDNRPLTIINRMEPSSLLSAMATRKGDDTIFNSISADPEKYRKALGVGS